MEIDFSIIRAISTRSAFHYPLSTISVTKAIISVEMVIVSGKSLFDGE